MSSGIGAALLDGLRAAGPREVLVHGGTRLSGDDVLGMVAAAAARLAASGVRRGDTVACLYGTGAESPVSRIAALALGCRFVHVWGGVPVEVAARAMRALDASALLYAPSRRAEAAPLLAACPVRVRQALDDDLYSGPAAGPVTTPPCDGVSLATFSSGTTGQHKIVAYDHAAEAAHLAAAQAMYGTPPWRLLVAPRSRYLPDMFVIWTLAGGGTVILEPDARPAQLAETIEREAATHLMAGRPVDLYALAEHLEDAPADLTSLRLIVYGGAAAVPARTARAAGRLGPLLMQNYGTSEGGFLTVLEPRDHARPELLMSVGRAAPGVELRVRAPDGTDLPPGEVGEVWVRSPQRMSGYVDDPARTAAAVRDGWARTGDVGRMDGDGYLFLLDRAEDRLPGGLYAHPIEHVLTGHPAVLDAAVFALPRAAGPVLAGVVVGRDGRRVDLDGLRALVRRALGDRCEPRHLWRVDALPRTPGGKPDKAALAARFAAGAGAPGRPPAP
ncbi:class I adenylate-forming enzyme family protein [Actinomadura opuntiae]|uniref:class I adenylate-forming enzyme family protein n=1 Tax=Actinomadura sp. OS1-43 TaxID=604315 RepID=UPI00255ADC98|nr:fatty acid--CoA ligase family protein [Actinomadura sp. OS1-43]MDL4820737.1 fatty acid--CoA ligase family protein [Actinomadura sp. OS1-43]